MKCILITGGSGLIGTALTKVLLAAGYNVRHLSRSKRKVTNVDVFRWDVKNGTLEEGALTGVDTIIHLAGAGIVDKPWTDERLRELERSRVDSALLLLKQPEAGSIKTFVSASGINYYGTITTDKVFVETDPPGDDVVARLTIVWENAADQWTKHCRVVKLRTPMVLARDGGALAKLTPPIRWGIGSPLGSGKQWMSWIHIDDLTSCYLKAIEDNAMRGAYNAVAAEQPSNAAFMQATARSMTRPFFMPAVPKFIMKMILGKRAQLVLNGSRSSNERLLNSGHSFSYDQLNTTLANLLQ